MKKENGYEILEDSKELLESDANNKEIKEFAAKLDQQAHEIEKMKMEMTKKFLKNKIEDNNKT